MKPQQSTDSFAFTADNAAWAQSVIKDYPLGKQASALTRLLWRAQDQRGGWLNEAAVRYVADLLSMAPVRAMEAATFYSMFNFAPVGRHFFQLCGTTPCRLRGAQALAAVLRDAIGTQGVVSADGACSWREVECLGACIDAPIIQVNDDYHERLDEESLRALIHDLRTKPGKDGQGAG